MTHSNQQWINHLAIDVSNIDLYESEDDQHIQSNKEVTITSNHPINDPLIITPDTNYDAFSSLSAVVNVQPTLETKTITTNGTYTPSSGYDGFSSVEVSVEGNSPVLQSKNITATMNGQTTISPSSGYDGLSSVNLTVNVPQPQIEIGKSQLITENGTTTISPDNNYDALENVRVTVNVPQPNVQENRTFTIDGFSGTITVKLTDDKPS